jgi:hypothetical protein
MLDQLSAADFTPHIGANFPAIFSDGQLDLRLCEVTELGRETADPARMLSRRPFSLTFLEPGGRRLPQHIYRLVHPTLGEIEIFLVPIGKDQSGLRMEAIFS